MSAFVTAAGPLRADPLKRVNYTLGMVLGVDEFQQDQLYHAAGRRWHNRLLHGYGTVWGLAVRTPQEGDVGEPEIRVTAGVAVDPCGREICVPATMCVRAGAWLGRHRPTLEPLFPEVAAGTLTELPLAVVLCHRECPDDIVPVPGEPCRTQEDAMQPSRIRDAFDLHLALRIDSEDDAPEANPTALRTFRMPHTEESAVQAFGALLRRVRTVCTGEPGMGRDELLAEVRALAPPAELAGEPVPVPEGPMLAIMPLAEPEIVLLHDEAADSIREAFRVWITEVRPRVRTRETGGNGDGCAVESRDCCVLLAEIDLPVTAGWAVRGDPFDPREEARPLLLHTRLLQEVLAGAALPCTDAVATLATAASTAAGALRLWLHHEEELGVPSEAFEVLVDGSGPADVVAIDDVPGVLNAFDVWLDPIPDDGAAIEVRLDLSLIDVPGSPTSSLADTLHCPAGPYLDRHGPEVRVYAVFHDYGFEHEGDVEGTHADTFIARLQGVTLDADDPGPGQVLTFDGDAWVPAAPSGGGGGGGPVGDAAGDVEGPLDDLVVVALQGTPVADAEPELNHYLRFNGSAWAPAHAGGFVLANAGRYAIVGAGNFDQSGPTISRVDPAYNGLEVRTQANGDEYVITFAGYQLPTDRHTYVVHAMLHDRNRRAASLVFDDFQDDHILMRRPFDMEQVGRLIIEITRIG